MNQSTRTVSWADPFALMAERRATGGRDFFGRMAAGELPQVPMYDLAGIRLVEVGDGRAVFAFTPAEYQYNPLGTIHGGLPATLVDSATGVSVQSQMAAGYTTATARLSIDFIRPMVAETGPLNCIAEVVKPGRQTAIADARLVDPEGKMYARGSATFMISKLDPVKLPPVPESDPSATRARTYSWTPPAALAEAGRAHSGADYLAAIAAGELPPPTVSDTFDFTLDRVGGGEAVFSCTPKEFHYNPMGSVHGGLPATLIDSATGVAVQSGLEKGWGFTTVNLTIDYFRAVTIETGGLTCAGKVVKAGRRLAVADADLIDAAGTVYARGSASCLIFKF